MESVKKENKNETNFRSRLILSLVTMQQNFVHQILKIWFKSRWCFEPLAWLVPEGSSTDQHLLVSVKADQEIGNFQNLFYRSFSSVIFRVVSPEIGLILIYFWYPIISSKTYSLLTSKTRPVFITFFFVWPQLKLFNLIFQYNNIE